MIDTHARKYIQEPINILSRGLSKLKVTPNMITLLSLIVGVLAALSYIFLDSIILSIILLWTSGLLDVVDGTLARLTNKQSSFGTILDISFDRIVEICLIMALVLKNPDISFLSIILLALILLSMTIFLSVGALAQNDGYKSFKYQAGLAERTEGFVMFSLIMIFSQHQVILMIVFCLIIFITIIQRFIEAYKLLK